MTKLDIINESVEYYSKNPRGLMITERRDYPIPAYFTPDGKMCAVGRCIDPKVKEDFLDTIGDCATAREEKRETAVWCVPVSDVPNIDKFLKKKYRGHEREFWEDLQLLHDRTMYWDDNKLTEYGEAFLELLRNKYA